MWVDEGSGAVKTLEVDSEFTIEGKAPGDAPVNARFSRALGSGDYFEVDVLELHGSGWVGVTTTDGFQQGYRCKGLFFGGPGNLSDGGCLKRGGVGEHLRKGQKIGILLELIDDGASAAVTVYQDGRCLGRCFAVRLPRPGTEVFPVVSAHSDGDRFAIHFDTAPAVQEREAVAPGSHPASGKWVLQRLSVGPELGEFPLAAKMDGRRVGLEVHVESTVVTLGFHVVNRINLQAVTVPDSSLAPFDSLKPGMCRITHMMGPPGAMEVETKVSESLPRLHKWMWHDGKLLLVGDVVEMEFVQDNADGEEWNPVTDVELP